MDVVKDYFERNQVVFKLFWAIIAMSVTLTAYAFKNFPTKQDVSEVYESKADAAEKYPTKEEIREAFNHLDQRFDKVDETTSYIQRHMKRDH